MERKSSIHIEKNGRTSHEHNFRYYDMPGLKNDVKNDYLVNNNLPKKTVINEKYNSGKEYTKTDLEAIKDDLKAKYIKTVGQKPQKNTKWFQEAVFNTNENTTLEQLKNVAKVLKKEFNITTVSLANHKDEYAKNLDGTPKFDENGKLKINYHAHIIFVNANMETGKSLRLQKADLVKMQTVIAETLGMERGKLGSKTVRLDQRQYKQERIKDDILAKKIEKIEEIKAVEKVSKKIGDLNSVNDELSKFNDTLINENTKLKQQLSNKNYEIESKKEIYRDVNNTNDFYKQIFAELGLSEFDLMQFKAQKTSAKQIAKELLNKLTDDYKNERNELIKSGIATQQQHTQLKAEFEQQKLVIKELKTEINKLKPEPITNNKKNIDLDIGM